ncbi:hypothetical protein FE782_31445 [Paenibacillus antri]|uniref:ORC1/DEAH AAA+ ATPase domain-containing protein n=1 Tax=Paenibacillus antri TaxID=2582848 RepID=A0A5R9GA61_9BACL|nr:hypothetical protein FE782_31445 [Paenibacillus antri]
MKNKNYFLFISATSGTGKTKFIFDYMKNHKDRFMLRITATPVWTLRIILQDILAAAGIPVFGRMSQSTLLERIKYLFASREKSLIIFDDA